jgi:hypothetical protein
LAAHLRQAGWPVPLKQGAECGARLDRPQLLGIAYQDGLGPGRACGCQDALELA